MLSIAGIFVLLASFGQSGYILNRAFAQDQTGDDSEAMPPIKSPTTDGTYIVQLNWEPTVLAIDRDTAFTITFLDKSGSPVKEPINFDFVIEGFDLSTVAEFYNQSSDQSGVSQPLIVRFHNASTVQTTVWVNFPNSSSISESASFSMAVTPEFPVSTILIVGIILSVASIVATKARYRIKRI